MRMGGFKMGNERERRGTFFWLRRDRNHKGFFEAKCDNWGTAF